MEDSLLHSLDKWAALILVEFDVEDGLPEVVELRWKGITFVQEVDYLYIPFRCFNCRKTGQLRSQCSGFQHKHHDRSIKGYFQTQVASGSELTGEGSLPKSFDQPAGRHVIQSPHYKDTY